MNPTGLEDLSAKKFETEENMIGAILRDGHFSFCPNPKEAAYLHWMLPSVSILPLPPRALLRTYHTF